MGEEGVPMIQELGGSLSGEAAAMIANLNTEFSKFGDLPDVAYTEFQAQMSKRAEAAGAFGSNILFLSSLGIDPAQLRTLLENPEFAGIVQQMADRIRLAPSEEAKAAAIAEVKETTGNVYAAENIDTEGFVLAMDLAMAASAQVAQTGAEGILEQLSSTFGKAPEEVRRMLQTLAEQYGIVIPGINDPAALKTAAQQKTAEDFWKGMPGGGSFSKANGGIVDFFANGGVKEKHNAQIAKAGDWRVWAEPETGGEAYIPLGRNKRNQALPVMAEVARRFGMDGYANGGFGPAGSSMVGGSNWGTPGSSVQVMPVPVPVQSKNVTNFNGPIQGVRMEDAEAFAARKRRQSRLAGGKKR
jgi:hypothetical protein